MSVLDVLKRLIEKRQERPEVDEKADELEGKQEEIERRTRRLQTMLEVKRSGK